MERRLGTEKQDRKKKDGFQEINKKCINDIETEKKTFKVAQKAKDQVCLDQFYNFKFTL